MTLPTLQRSQGFKGKGGCLGAFGKGWRGSRDRSIVAVFWLFFILPPDLGTGRREEALPHRDVGMGARPAWWWGGLHGGEAGEAGPLVQVLITLNLCV